MGEDVDDRLDESLEGTPSAVSDNSTDSAKGRRDYPSRKYIQSWYCPEDKLELLGKLKDLQAKWGWGKSQLIVWLLEQALELVDQGKIKPKKKTETVYRPE